MLEYEGRLIALLGVICVVLMLRWRNELPAEDTQPQLISNRTVFNIKFESKPPSSRDRPEVFSNDSSLMPVDELDVSLFPEPPSVESLPPWLREYAVWHASQRKDLLLSNNSSGLLMIRICPYTCGGLNDRMSRLGEYLYEAYTQKRVLLIKWYHTKYELESFLVPGSIIDWRLPSFENITETPELLLKFASLHPDRVVVKTTRDVADTPLNYTMPSFQHLWNFMFTPSTKLKLLIKKSFQRLSLKPRQYNALHLRVRHPAQFGRIKDNKMDLEGLPWNTKKGDRDFAIQTALNALECTNRTWPNDLPIYIYSDCSDLVDYLVNGTNIMTTVSNQQLVARPSQEQNSHLDYANGTSFDQYANAFVDLWFGALALHLGLGVGNFAILAHHIGENPYVLIHTKPRDGTMAKRWAYEELNDSNNQTILQSCF